MAQGSTPDAVLRDCLKSGLGARALRLTDVHVDLRLPDRIITGAAPLCAGVSALCGWLDAGGGDEQRAIAIWADEEGGMPSDGWRTTPVPILIEAARHAPDATGEGPVAGIPGLREAADALGAEIVGPATGADGIERLGLRFISRATPSSAPLATHWGSALRGKRLVILRRAALDPRRLERSFAALGLDTRVGNPAEAAFDAASAAARAGLPCHLALVCPFSLGADPAATLGRLRALPAPAQRIVLVGPEDTDAADYPGVERVVPQRSHWRRVIDALFDLAQPAERPAPGDASAIPAFSGRRILIAEDVRTNQALLRAMLAPTGARVAIASDGAQAVEAMQADPADLVLMDIQMPVMDGLEAARQIRALGHPARIIALTAHAREADRARYLSSGMDGYLAKPIRVDDLYAVLCDALAAERG